MSEFRRDGTLAWLRPDSKTQVTSFLLIPSTCEVCGFLFQVTVEYHKEQGACVPIRVHTVVISVQHSPDISLDEMRKQLKEAVIKVSLCPYVPHTCFPMGMFSSH